MGHGSTEAVSAGTEMLQILQRPDVVATRCTEGFALPSLMRGALLAIALGAASFGAALGSFRGDAQTLLAAVKLPLVLLVTLSVFAPAFHALARGLGHGWGFANVVALSCATVARAALVLGALAPPLWFAIDLGLPYHAATLTAVVMTGLAGLLALAIPLAALHRSARDLVLGGLGAAVFFLALAQSSWVLRPYLVRPRETELVVLRGAEGSWGSATITSLPSALGHYAPEEAP